MTFNIRWSQEQIPQFNYIHRDRRTDERDRIGQIVEGRVHGPFGRL